jgi:hypothetical protein
MISAPRKTVPPSALLGGGRTDLIAAERIVAAPLQHATSVRKQCATCGPPMTLTDSADLLTRAETIVSSLPSDAAIRGAEAGLRAALATPPQPADVALIVSTMLDGLGQRVSAVTEAYIATLAGVLGTDSVGDDLDLRKTFPTSTLVAVLAASHILRTAKFAPRPAELLDAARTVYARAVRTADDLRDYGAMRDSALTILWDHADDETYARLQQHAPDLFDREVPF